MTENMTDQTANEIFGLISTGARSANENRPNYKNPSEELRQTLSDELAEFRETGESHANKVNRMIRGEKSDNTIKLCLKYRGVVLEGWPVVIMPADQAANFANTRVVEFPRTKVGSVVDFILKHIQENPKAFDKQLTAAAKKLSNRGQK